MCCSLNCENLKFLKAYVVIKNIDEVEIFLSVQKKMFT